MKPQKEFIGNINSGDKLTLLPHRLLALGENKIAIIAENNNGWGITNINSYLNIKKFLSPPGVIFTHELKSELLKSLWNSNLLAKNGLSLGALAQPFAPILLVLKLTGNCNFNCTYCYDHDPSRINTTIPLTKVKETITTIAAKDRGINLVFHGGEPLLNFPLLQEITIFAKKTMKRINFFMQTNGSLFTNEIINFLEKYNFYVGVSLDGMTKFTNTHRAVKSGITCLQHFQKNYKEYGDFFRRRLGIICTLSKLNLPSIPKFILWLQNLDIKSIALSPLMPSGKGKQLNKHVVTADELIDLYNSLITMVKNRQVERISLENINKFISSLIKLRASDLCHANPCGAGDNFLTIDAQGNYRACDCIYDDYFVLTANNYTPGSRKKILQRREYMKNHDCSDCAIFGFCGGGCIAEAIATNGTANSLPEKNCKLKKFFYKTLLKEYALDEKRPLFAYYTRMTGEKVPGNLNDNKKLS